ncbi:MAG: NAD-binding protein [Kiritimatiellae bacterium]|nr:NAD-binding protein [Kiritimatiellia bacterium]
MRTVIVGAGFTGIQLARSLVAEGGRVALIDNDSERTRHARDILDCEVIEAEGNSPETLDAAGVADADALVALTEDDEVNMIVCSLADAVYPDVLKIARVRNYAYYTRTEAMSLRRHDGAARPLFGIDRMLNPDVEAADAISNVIEHGTVGNVIDLGGGHGVVSLQVSPGSPLDGTPLGQLPRRDHLIAWAETSDGPLLPSGNTVLHAGDRIGIVAPLADIPDLASSAASLSAESAPRRIAVFGAGRIGSLVVDRLASTRRSGWWRNLFDPAGQDRGLLLVDPDQERCREAARRFEGVRVICGDVTEADLVHEEALDECDLVVAASHNHERNLILSAYLKSRGARRSIALTASAEFDDIAVKLGVDVAVPLRDTVVDSILGNLRGRSVKAVHSVCNRAFEIVECDVAADGKAAGKALKDLPKGENFLVLLVRDAEDGQFQIPDGGTVLNAGSRAVIAVRAGDRRAVRIFGGRN